MHARLQPSAPLCIAPKYHSHEYKMQQQLDEALLLPVFTGQDVPLCRTRPDEVLLLAYKLFCTQNSHWQSIGSLRSAGIAGLARCCNTRTQVTEVWVAVVSLCPPPSASAPLCSLLNAKPVMLHANRTLGSRPSRHFNRAQRARPVHLSASLPSQQPAMTTTQQDTLSPHYICLPASFTKTVYFIRHGEAW